MGQPEIFTENDAAVLLIWIVIFGIALFSTLIDCQQESFKDQIINQQRRRFWLSISGVLATLTVIGTTFLQLAEIKHYVLMSFPVVVIVVAILSIILWVITRTPALLQNPVGNETEIKILFATYLFPLALSVLLILFPAQHFFPLLLMVFAFTVSSTLLSNNFVYGGLICLVIIYALMIVSALFSVIKNDVF